ncbi:MAG: phosphatidylserine/phosphatidylglycerophosphate/cardiolipin synthase family protein [Gemmataceae bacterium]|nr:phosphatidylserine/phosphatidylglycerophosphate/cardiolipin synthase family protein [Gemmataceae bacterium]
MRIHLRLIAVWALLPVAGFASGSEELRTEQQFKRAAEWTNVVPRVFVKARKVRIYFTNADEQLMFKAAWKRSRVAAQDLNYRAAELEFDASSPKIPSSGQWREARVLTRDESERFMRVAAEHLAPARPLHGVYCQYALGDLVLFRSGAGDVKLVRFEEKPENVTIDARLGRHELAEAVAKSIETDVRAAYPGNTSFVLTPTRAIGSRLVLIDFAAREAVALYAPQVSADPRHAAKLALTAANLASFAIVDNGWAFLKNPVSSLTRTLNQGLQWSVTLLGPRLRDRASTIPAVTNGPGMDLSDWERWLDQHTGMPRERGTVRLLPNGETFFPLIERRLAAAEQNIDIHVCIFDRDDVAARFADVLKQRATNVDVRVVFDRINSFGAGRTPPATPAPDGFIPPRKISAYLRNGSSVQVRPQLNPGFTADHSKVFLIDGRYAYIGGMNIGREYRYEWHDLMAEIEGPVVTSLQKEFDKKWAQTSLWGDCALAVEALRGSTVVSNIPPAADSIELRRLYTKTFDRQIRRAEMEAVKRARNHIYLQNAYLYDNGMIIALVKARLRGVDVRVIMPAENDFKIGHGSNLVTANYLLRHGVRVYFYPGMTHVKAMQIDGWTCFGSANFDALSLRLNREANLATSDSAFAARFKKEVFDTDFARCRELKESVPVGWNDHLGDVILNQL